MLHVRLLGQFSLHLDGQPVEIPSRPAQSLLAYLCLNPRKPQRREKLAGLFWPEASERNARSNLRHALWRIRKALENNAGDGQNYLLADDLAITFILRPGDWLDAEILVEKIPQDAPIEDWIRAVVVYEGELLPGFYDDWVVLEREHLQAVFERKIGMFLERLEAKERWVDVLEWGERWIAYGNTPEPAYRALMLAHASLGDLASAATAYQRCVESLRTALGVEPSEHTRRLFVDIQAGRLKMTAPGARRFTPTSPELPDFLLEKTGEPENGKKVFVGRENELTFLEGHLAKALSGKGRVAFISGEAGSGKTALLQTFIQRSVRTHPDLISVSGNSNAFFGVGDPYLPFRDILSMLTGELESRLRASAISPEHARRLWAFFPLAIHTLVDLAPDLIDAFVPGRALLARAIVVQPEWDGWLDRLQKIVEGERALRISPEQAQLFEQFTQLLQALANKHPLLIVLDDLQWADSGSIHLLFHLGRRIVNYPILILGAYRQHDVALGRGPERHPLEPVLHEFQRTFGDILVDLDQAEKMDGRQFVDALLDSEPNRLDEAFRLSLYQRTKGQPLFTIELLRDLQERGDIDRDENGRWKASAELDWMVIPAEVEGVIQERTGRLEAELREILSVASVEGEEFTVQVLAQVQQTPERILLHRLSHDLEKRHRLVQELGEGKAGEQLVSRFRFNHALIQQYIYNYLGAGERKLLHGEVAAALEKFYAEDIPQVTIQLARHYSAAGMKEKAVKYLMEAGDRSRAFYAFPEAIQAYQQALAFLKEMGDRERAARTLMKLGLTYHNAFDFENARRAYDDGFALWQRVGETQENLRKLAAPHPLRLGIEFLFTLDPSLALDMYSYAVINQLFCGLMAWTPDLDLVPAAASRWEVLKGGSKYVFHLREDLRWSDGAPVTARDFEFAWKRALDPATGSQPAFLLYDIQGARDFHQGRLTVPDQVGVSCPDPLTLEVELEGPASYFPYLMGLPVSYALPRQTVERFGRSWTEASHMVTNGPFLLEVYQPGKSLVLSRNPRYFGGWAGNVERVEITVSTDRDEWDRMYAADELDTIPVSFFIRRQPAEEYFSLPSLNTAYLGFDTTLPPFNDRRVRRAFALATDRETASVVLKGSFFPGNGGFVPPGMPGHSPEIGLAFDPDQARQMLASAGFPTGKGFPPVKLLAADNPAYNETLIFLKEHWREILGVDSQIGIRTVEYLQNETNEPYHMVLAGWTADYPDPHGVLHNFWAGSHVARRIIRWKNETYDRMIEEARRVSEQGERLKLYAQADRILIEEAAIVPLSYWRMVGLLKPWVHTLPHSPLGHLFLKDVIIEPH